MRKWPVEDATTRFGEILHACLTQGPQLVTTRGSDAAVLVLWRNGVAFEDLPSVLSKSCC